MKSKIKALIFDMDGLLFDSEKVVQRAWNITGPEFGIENLGAYIYGAIGMNAARRKEYFQKTFAADFPFEAFSERTREVFREIVDKEGLEMKAGAKELILCGKEKGYKLAVATSSSRKHATRLLGEAGIYEYFDGFVFGDMVSHSKPAPEIYQKACEKLHVLPEESIAFEDAPSGVRSAAAAGLRVVLVPDLVQPPKEIQDLTWKQVETLEQIISVL